MTRKTNRIVSIATLAIALVALMSSCKKDTDPNTASFKIVKETEKIVVGTTEAAISGTYEYPGTINSIKVRVGVDEQLFGSDIYTAEVSGKAYSVNITGLCSGTKYYYRYEVNYGAKDDYLTETDSFTTQSESPTVKTLEVQAIDSTTFRVKCVVDADGGSEVTERGICFNTYGDPTLDDETMQHASGGVGQYTLRIEGLALSTKYYVCAYAKNASGIGFGEVLEFETLAEARLPEVSTVEVSNVTSTTATCMGNVASDGGLELTDRGVCWSLSANPTMIDSHAVAMDATLGVFEVAMTGLTPNKTYHVRAYATNAKGTAYGNDLTFTTTEGLPVVTTSGITEISATSAKGGGDVTDQGASTVTERGICWGTSHNPTTAGIHASNGTGAGSYTVSMTNLTPNATYYVRAYATNSQGTAYGAEVSFTALEGLPVVLTLDMTDITSTTANGHGKVTDQGGSAVTERGICWGINHNPTTSGSHSNSGTGMGSFTVNMTGLTPNTTYYVRAYAINSAGTSYGSEVGCTTQQATTYTISVSANPTNGGMVSGGDTYQQGQSCTVQATANNGFTFTNWTENGNVVSTNANYTFTVNSNRMLIAQFQAQSQAPTGAINGLFSVSASKQVWFSQGNLQYIGSAGTPYWKFAEHQWDYLGATTGQNSSNIDVDRDLFGWGTSGWNSGAYCYRPWSVSEDYSAYYVGNSDQNDLTGSFSNADWGYYNAISNGGDQAGLWRTLTISEWRYVLINRNTTYGIHYAKAQVADVYGLILLPDNWNPGTYNLTNPDNSSASYSSNVISATQWTTLENAGAVFLPAAGGRSGTSIMNLGSYGTYWSASSDYGSSVYGIRVKDNGVDIFSPYRYFGYSVRVVQDY